jgi:thiol-disulfide isomerase/thioredoxin
MTKRLVVPLVLLAAIIGALALTAGGDRTTGDAEEPGAPVPAVSLPRLDGSGELELARLAQAETPTLLWFWAPWCEVCNHEAPTIERLAADAGGELAVVAIGGRDQRINGPAFVERHRLRSPIVVFDEPMTVWREYAIPGQPAGVLLDREGRERGRWLGAFDPDEVVAAARDL